MTAPPTSAVTRLDELPLRPVVTVVPDAPLDQVARVMRAHNVSALVVGHAGDPVAIVTERDLTQALADGCPPGERVVAVASPSPLTVAHDASVIEAATLMLNEGLRHLVVSRQHRVVGIVSIRDVLAAFVSAVTPDTVFVRLQRITIEAPEYWLG
jgi:signal-transduction protein with cAMP-binding, CBS, and nucleotidyltransferase domain